jgi:antitoxin (DNA-binding transcriptional repressor) of toxin-antitoxin stability system
MSSTLTELHRQTRKVLRPVLAGHSVQLTEHGQPVAKVQPDYPVLHLTVEEFRALPLTDAELDAAINRTTEELRHARLP